jgi:uncharacterized protein YegL
MSDDATSRNDMEIAEVVCWHPVGPDSEKTRSLETLLNRPNDLAAAQFFRLRLERDHTGVGQAAIDEVVETVERLFRRRRLHLRQSAAVVILRVPDADPAAGRASVYSFGPPGFSQPDAARTAREVGELARRIGDAAQAADVRISMTLPPPPRPARREDLSALLTELFARHPSCLIVLSSVALSPLDHLRLHRARPVRLSDSDQLVIDTPGAEAMVRLRDTEDAAAVFERLESSEVELGALRMTRSAGTPGGPPDLPMRARTDPLPHDGLFIRRNNAFGTRSTVGIAELIEHGVLIDQTQIRFDDFIVAGTDEVPAPPAGEAIAVSHGGAVVPGNSKAYPATTHFLEIALRAADEAGDDAAHGEALPVNFVFVVDTSYSMRGEKLDMVKSSLRRLYEQLRDIDIFGIVTFDTQVRTALKATPKRELTPDRLTGVVNGLSAGGGTDLNLGLLYGADEIGRYGEGRADLVNCLYLFSDGDPTSGETNWIKIRKNIAERLRGDLTISCFGFGSDARMRELEALAGLAGGHSTFVIDPDDIGLNLQEDLTRREHLAAINVQLRLEIAPNIRIWHIYGHDLVTDPAVRDAVI